MKRITNAREKSNESRFIFFSQTQTKKNHSLDNRIKKGTAERIKITTKAQEYDFFVLLLIKVKNKLFTLDICEEIAKSIDEEIIHGTMYAIFRLKTHKEIAKMVVAMIRDVRLNKIY